jgi:hypothetical protein
MNKELEERLVYIGVSFSIEGNIPKKTWVDIERTLVDVCYEVESDSRLLGLLFSWILVHGKYLNADKLIKLYRLTSKFRGDSPWFYALCAFGVEKGILKLKKGIKKQREAIFFRNEKSKTLFEMKGSIPYLEKIGILIPEGSIRIREKDVLPAEILLKNNKQFKNRLLYGANWRADIITAIEWGIENPNRISKMLGCSYEPANRIFREYMLVRGH